MQPFLMEPSPDTEPTCIVLCPRLMPVLSVPSLPMTYAGQSWQTANVNMLLKHLCMGHIMRTA